MTDTLARVRHNALMSLRPPARLRTSDWLQKNIRLPEDVSAVPGPIKLTKPQIEIADAIGDPAFERITVVKPVRVGFTTLLSGVIGSFVANEPSPILALLPTEADARDYMVSDLEPIFAASPALAGLLGNDDSENRNTLLSRRFPGGSLKIVAAKAPRNLRRHNVRILLIDEADAMDPTAEGNPLTLAERRTLSFANRKIIIGSTPLIEETSNVLRSYAASDQRIFEVCCPECGSYFELLWAHIKWDDGKPKTAECHPPCCGVPLAEKHKLAMVEQGRFRATMPDVKGHAGFRMNALISNLRNASWGRLAAEFLAKKDDPAELQVFVNTILAEGWKGSAEEVSETDLASRVEPFGLNNIPVEVLAVTAGVDVQDDRLEITFAGWTRRNEILVLGHDVIWGSPDDDTTWQEFEALSRTTWAHPLGGQIAIAAMVIDSGDGDWTEKVYGYCFPRMSRRIMAGKGVSGTRPILQMSKGKVKGGYLFLIGVDGVKTTLLNRMARGESIRFSDDLQPVYFEQLASERRVVRYVRGQPVKRFERKPGARAEALDCLVYAFAARHGVTLNFDQREAALKGEAQAKASPQVIKSKFMNR